MVVSRGPSFTGGAGLLSLALLLHPVHAGAAQYGDTILIVPFEDHSYFRGTWDLRQGIPRQLSELLRQAGGFAVLPPDTIHAFLPEGEDLAALSEDQVLAIGRAAGADLELTGDILSFSIKRFNVGNPFVGGYSSYTALVEVDTRLLRTLPGARGGEAIRGRAEATNSDLGLSLLGKPTKMEAMLSELNEVPFGAQKFHATIIGKVTLEALQQIAGGLAAKVSDPVALQQQSPKILSIEGDEGFVNLGVADEIEAGYRFVVYSHRDTQRVGVVQIVEIYTPHLSRIRTLEGRETIREGDLLRSPQRP